MTRALRAAPALLLPALFGGCIFLESYDDPASDPIVTSSSTTASSGGGASTTTTTTSAGGEGGSTASAGGGGAGGEASGPGGAGGTGGQGGGAGGQGGAGGAGGVGTGGAGGAGGAGGGSGGAGGAGGCLMGDTMPCYTGPAGTQNVGICLGGLATCDAMGAFGPCVGEVLPSTEDCATLADDDCDGIAPVCPGGTLFATRFGDALGDQLGSSIDVDSANNVFLAGTFASAIDFGGGALTSAGGQDFYVASFDANLQHRWSKRFGDASDQAGKVAAVDANGDVLVSGLFQGAIDFGLGSLTTQGLTDIPLAKLDTNGNAVWAKRFGGPGDDLVASIATDSANNILLAGYSSGIVTFGGPSLPPFGGADAFLVKLTSTGAHLWSLRFGDSQDQQAYGVAVDSNGNVVVVGRFSGTINLGGGQTLVSAGFDDIFVAKFDPSGNFLWSKRFGGTAGDAAASVAIDAAGNIVFTGRVVGPIDFGGGTVSNAGAMGMFLVKLDPNGGHTWSKIFGDAADQAGFSVALDAAGNVLLSGTNEGIIALGANVVSAGLKDIYVGKFDALGNHLWSRGFGDASDQLPGGLVAGSLGHVFVSGDLRGTVDLGTGPLAGGADFDAFLLKLAP